jgi:cbb3-type cytochrome oxidase maturation protein
MTFLAGAATYLGLVGLLLFWWSRKPRIDD